MLLSVLAMLSVIGQQAGQAGSPPASPPPSGIAASQSGPSDAQSLVITPAHQRDIDGDNAMGKHYAAEVDKELKETKDLKAQARVDRIGAQLAEIANSTHLTALWGDKRFSKFTYHFKVVQGVDVNAFSLPGGYIYVYDGLVKYVESDDELAGVLAHEISHAALRHVATLQRESQRLSLLTLPLVLIGIFAGGASGAGQAFTLGSLITQASGSGWSQNAELAADFGGLQIMAKSHYNAVGLLTTMERFARDERQSASVDWGIYRTHPPSALRAQRLTEELTAAHIPIRRSAVATSFRAIASPADSGQIVVKFNRLQLGSFGGSEAVTRSSDATQRLNQFFDQVPEVYEAAIGSDGNIYGRGKMLIEITDEDAMAGNQTRAAMAAADLQSVKAALFNYASRIWATQSASSF